MSAGENTRVRVAPDVRVREFDGALVILDLGGGQYFGVNELGAQLWERLVAGKSPAEAAAELVGVYDVELPQLLADFVTLTDEFVARGLVVPLVDGEAR